MSIFDGYGAFKTAVLNANVQIFDRNNGNFKHITKHAYSNIQKISPPKIENFQIKKI